MLRLGLTPFAMTGTLISASTPGIAEDSVPWRHALSLFGDPRYSATFEHFEYVNPSAPKGGTLRLAAVGTYDSMNPFILKGVAAAGSLLLYNRLCTKAKDEYHTVYGQLARRMQMPQDRTWVLFDLHPEARWHDGRPVTAEDVAFSFRTLVAEGIPFYRSFYADVDTVEVVSRRQVRFRFKQGVNREMPMILGQLRVLPEHYWEDREFAASTLDPPLGSGPYRIAAFEPGRSITYERVSHYWGRELPVHRGRHNFDRIHYEYYRDNTVAVEAFKAGEYEVRFLGNSKEWASDYRDFEPIDSGRMAKESIPHQLIRGMEGFCFNTRRSKFADRRVRSALACAYDFEWTNDSLFYGLYTRSNSYWGNSILGASGLPHGKELELLEPYEGRIPQQVFTTPYLAPTTHPPGSLRQNLSIARDGLASAGWRVEKGRLIHQSNGERMTIEFLLSSPTYERVLGPVVQNLERLGIAATIRTVDAAQYQYRIRGFDYDVVVAAWRQTLSPGNEQRNFWSSAAADSPGSRNYAGIRDAVVDELIERQIAAPDRETQVALTRALDRVLLWGHYVIPGSHSREHRFAYWRKFGKPDEPPANGLGFPDTWWYDAELAASNGF